MATEYTSATSQAAAWKARTGSSAISDQPHNAGAPLYTAGKGRRRAPETPMMALHMLADRRREWATEDD